MSRHARNWRQSSRVMLGRQASTKRTSTVSCPNFPAGRHEIARSTLERGILLHSGFPNSGSHDSASARRGSGAPRPMKMGTLASPWHYDAMADYALQPANLRGPEILRCTWWAAVFPISRVVRLPFDSGRLHQFQDRRDGPQALMWVMGRKLNLR